jgi:hypothetical protein
MPEMLAAIAIGVCFMFAPRLTGIYLLAFMLVMFGCSA